MMNMKKTATILIVGLFVLPLSHVFQNDNVTSDNHLSLKDVDALDLIADSQHSYTGVPTAVLTVYK